MYQLLDSGYGQKLERFGSVVLIRPAPQASWHPVLPLEQWEQADGCFMPEQGWGFRNPTEPQWYLTVGLQKFLLRYSESGQVGIFPEQIPLWEKIRACPVKKALNLFAYSGGSSLAAALGGAEVTHIDASKTAVKWAQENAALNYVSLRTRVDDVMTYCQRACRRQERYDAIILDPPSFGKGTDSKHFCLNRDLEPLLKLCKTLHTGQGYLLLSCHTPGYTAEKLTQLLAQEFSGTNLISGDLYLPGPLNLPSGAYVFAYF
ncbi:MAG: class I SAM-dependent methyltransferase [Verrucomicrobia bacterium]|nr:class I SAM-dependent methyltransferase [Verrucomicrobiota bacterium]MBS0646596.1 class I SAM-dependent methyltransferase [Verrucomicrobiota bacterium]